MSVVFPSVGLVQFIQAKLDQDISSVHELTTKRTISTRSDHIYGNLIYIVYVSCTELGNGQPTSSTSAEAGHVKSHHQIFDQLGPELEYGINCIMTSVHHFIFHAMHNR